MSGRGDERQRALRHGFLEVSMRFVTAFRRSRGHQYVNVALVVLALPVVFQVPEESSWIPLPVLGSLPGDSVEHPEAARVVSDLLAGSDYSALVVYGGRVFGNPCESLVIGGASDTSGIGGASDVTGIGGASDTARIGGASDTSGIGSASDTSGVGGASDAAGIGGASDTSGIGGGSDASGIGGAARVVSCAWSADQFDYVIRVPRELPVLEFFGLQLTRIDRSRIRIE